MNRRTRVMRILQPVALLALVSLLFACGSAVEPSPRPTVDPLAPVLAWTREGGVAGFHDELTVLADGTVLVSSRWLEGGPLRASLTPEQQARLDGWVSELEAFARVEADPDIADSFTFRLNLAGRGQARATEGRQQEIQEWAGELFESVVSQVQVPTPTPEIFQPLPDDERAYAAARALLAQELGIDELSIRRQEMTAHDWPDACLAAGPAAGEMCAEVITPGYRFVLAAGEKLYEVRTNFDGTIVRLAEDVPQLQ